MRLRRRHGAVVLLLLGLPALRVALVVHSQAATGPVLATVTVGQLPGMVAVDARTNRAFVTNSADHTVSVLDARSGAVLHTVAVSSAPYVVHTAARTGRAFVISDGNILGVLDAASGALVRSVAECCAGDLAVDDHTAHVVMIGASPNLQYSAVMLLDGRSGTLVHSDTTTGPALWGWRWTAAPSGPSSPILMGMSSRS